MERWSTNWCVSDWDKAKALPRTYYSQNTLEVAQDLLGKVLMVKSGASVTVGRIVETEAYRGNDPASHSARGETPRCSIMFGDPGVAYVYFIYGMYEMLNFVTEPKGFPGAVLIRALEPLYGEKTMTRRRGTQSRYLLTSGPGKLCRAMGIKMSHNGASLQGPELKVLNDGYKPESISCSPRVGISLATDLPWRYFITGNPFVSRAKQNAQSAPVEVLAG